jgi:predicted amidohydrolase
MRLALMQLHCPKGEVERNLAAHAAHIEEARTRDVDVLCFPEMSLTGYLDPARWPEAVLTLDAPAVRGLIGLTAGDEMVVLAGLVERNPGGKPFITQIAARDGEMIGVYRKITVIEDEEPWFSPGPGEIAVLPHERGGIGLAICADINNPAVFARLAAGGAGIVFEAAAPGLYGARETRDWRSGWQWWRGECHEKLGGYAREHGIVIAVATQAGRTVDEDFPGGGYLFSPDGRCLAESDDWSPGVLYAEVTVPSVRERRRT